MTYQSKASDYSITQKVGEQLCSRGVRSPCRISVITSEGNVTLSGTIQHEHQRRTILHTTQAVEGVQRVVDRLRLISEEKNWK
jgi:osmotically-inducible protein OsmY